MAERRKTGGGVGSLIRRAGEGDKKAGGKAAKTAGPNTNIFNILEYIEQPWGLQMDGVDGRAKLYPANVPRPPHWLSLYDCRHESASNDVANASPIPAIRNLTGAAAITASSTSTRSGLRGRNK